MQLYEGGEKEMLYVCLAVVLFCYSTLARKKPHNIIRRQSLAHSVDQVRKQGIGQLVVSSLRSQKTIDR